MATQPQLTTGSPRQLLLVAALVAVLLLVVGVLVVRPLLSGGTEDQGVAAPTPLTAAAAAPGTTPQVATPSTSVPQGAAGSVKDPFRPLVSSGATAATTQSGLTPAVPGAATQSTVPGAAAPSASTPGGGATADRKVTLVNVAGGKAKVIVDGRSYPEIALRLGVSEQTMRARVSRGLRTLRGLLDQQQLMGALSVD